MCCLEHVGRVLGAFTPAGPEAALAVQVLARRPRRPLASVCAPLPPSGAPMDEAHVPGRAGAELPVLGPELVHRVQHLTRRGAGGRGGIGGLGGAQTQKTKK